MIGIIDYGLGNVKAFANVYKKLNISNRIVRYPQDLDKVSKIILPGVGAFDHAMHKLQQSGMKQILTERVLDHKVPVLGICVGMQILARSSEEGNASGLGWVNAKVKRFCPEPESDMQIPHMGWNDIRLMRENAILHDLEQDSRFYFLHSFYFEVDHNEDMIAATDYYGEFASVVNKGNVFGVQFHPEKSHQWGIKLLKNFVDL